MTKKPTTTKARTPATKPTTTRARPKKSIGRAIDTGDRARLLHTLQEWAASRSFLALRTRAFVMLCWGSGLRVSEAIALNISQVLEDQHVAAWKIRGTAYLQEEQSKGNYGAGPFAIPKVARAALRDYLVEGNARGWLQFPKGPLFVAIKGRGKVSHERLSVRSAQHAWDDLQQRARVAQHYRSHDLRHDAITRFSNAANGDVYRVQMFGRFNDVRTASRYVHTSVTTLAELSEIAARAE